MFVWDHINKYKKYKKSTSFFSLLPFFTEAKQSSNQVQSDPLKGKNKYCSSFLPVVVSVVYNAMCPQDM